MPNTIDLSETCICGEEGFFAAHYANATSVEIIVFSCSVECEARIEALRVAGKLTTAKVDKARGE